MADAKQCDRCGGYYGGTNHHFFKSSGEWRAKEYDLCDDCFKELGEFMCGVKPKNLLERMWCMVYKKDTQTKDSEVAYLCDGQACENGCGSPPCHHTWNIEHAKNFKKIIDNKWEEVESTRSGTVNVDDRIEKALEIAYRYSQIDGEHHKAWCIDQMVRALIGSEGDYEQWIFEANCGEDGPNTYTWDCGIAP